MGSPKSAQFQKIRLINSRVRQANARAPCRAQVHLTLPVRYVTRSLVSSSQPQLPVKVLPGQACAGKRQRAFWRQHVLVPRERWSGYGSQPARPDSAAKEYRGLGECPIGGSAELIGTFQQACALLLGGCSFQ